ncbi:MAG: acyltransferase [Paucibacter sp.]|nr:acyltransferase [Roseateles sp.]
MSGEPGRQRFRTDINGLRAWAVIAVVLFHFKLPACGGGFVGVDVFFVISGFLMTGIVLAGLEQDRFSLTAFYAARARRIVPALAVLCAVLLLLGWRFLLSGEYKLLATHVGYSLSFLSNIEFWQEAGYFDAASHEKWLLHTWSLAVEWQFYLLLPIVLWSAWQIRAGRNVQRLVVIATLLASLLACLLITPQDPSKAFFWLHTRAWEMLGGGLISLSGTRKNASEPGRRILQGIGLVLILAAVLMFDSFVPWRGWRAVVPVLGAMLVIRADRSSTLLSARPLQWLGDRSYSVYLWHWPIYVALNQLEWQGAVATVGGLLLTLVLGHASFALVEAPARRRLARVSAMSSLGWLVGSLMLVLAPAVAIWRLNGLGNRLPAVAELAAAEAYDVNPRRQDCYSSSKHAFPSCIHGGTHLRAIALGDSHVSATVSALALARPRDQDGVQEWSIRGCQFVPGMQQVPGRTAPDDHGISCAEFTQRVLRELELVPAEVPVVIMGRYAASAFGSEARLESIRPAVYFSQIHESASPQFLAEFGRHITETACMLARQRTVFLVRPFPEMGLNVPKVLSHRLAMAGTSPDLWVSIEQYRRRNAWIWTAQDEARDRCGARVLDPLPYLCTEGRCWGSREGRPLYFDDNHLSEYGNKLLVPMFAEVFHTSKSPASSTQGLSSSAAPVPDAHR